MVGSGVQQLRLLRTILSEYDGSLCRQLSCVIGHPLLVRWVLFHLVVDNNLRVMTSFRKVLIRLSAPYYPAFSLFGLVGRASCFRQQVSSVPTDLAVPCRMGFGYSWSFQNPRVCDPRNVLGIHSMSWIPSSPSLSIPTRLSRLRQALSVLPFGSSVHPVLVTSDSS